MGSSSLAVPLRVCLTTGDSDGIGLEVTSKALDILKPQKDVQFYLWRSPDAATRELRRIKNKFKVISVSTWNEALQVKVKNTKCLIDICSKHSPPKWVETSAQACLLGYADAMVTAPLSKTLIMKSGFDQLGHTEMLAKISGEKDLFMTFIGPKFNVLICTGHMPLSAVPKKLTEQKVQAAIEAALFVRQSLPPKRQKLPIGILGLNPHSGETGLIGDTEVSWLEPLIERLSAKGLPLVGPLVPDAAFLKSNWSCFSMYVCLYHDQGLIPFKLVHGHDAGVHLTSGLPFIRTSVDHGTAKDIFGRNRANPRSMLEAINWAIKLARQKRAIKKEL